MTKAEQRIRDLCKDPACHRWFKQAAESVLQCDPVDAANDARVLARLLFEHNSELYEG